MRLFRQNWRRFHSSCFQFAGQDDDHDQAADDAEANDETYLIPDADALESEPVENPNKAGERIERSATPDRHVGTGSIAGPTHLEDKRYRTDGSSQHDASDQEADSRGQEQGPDDEKPRKPSEQPGDNSDDSLSLSE